AFSGRLRGGVCAPGLIRLIAGRIPGSDDIPAIPAGAPVFERGTENFWTSVHLWTFEYKSVRTRDVTCFQDRSWVGKGVESDRGDGGRRGDERLGAGGAGSTGRRCPETGAWAVGDGGPPRLQHGGIKPVRPG